MNGVNESDFMPWCWDNSHQKNRCVISNSLITIYITSVGSLQTVATSIHIFIFTIDCQAAADLHVDRIEYEKQITELILDIQSPILQVVYSILIQKNSFNYPNRYLFLKKDIRTNDYCSKICQFGKW